jgi:hypothetical protein
MPNLDIIPWLAKSFSHIHLDIPLAWSRLMSMEVRFHFSIRDFYHSNGGFYHDNFAQLAR